MASYIIKNKLRIERQKNDHFTVGMIIDPELPIESDFTFGIYTKQGKVLVLKENPTKETNLRKLTFNFVPADTVGILHTSVMWELQMKTAGNEYYTVGTGDFYLIPTNIINE